MAVPILRLNIDNNPRIIVKQDSIPVTITGYTQTIVQGSGATTVTESGVNPKIYTVYTPIGSAQWGSILGDVTTQTDLTDYVTQSISAATSGLTSSWNEITDKPQWLDYDVKEEFQTGHTHSYNNLDDLPSLFSGDYDDLTNKPDLSIYLTGYTVTADDVTGITASLYAPIIHTHPYSGLTGLPSLFSGDYDDLTNKPDLSVYQPVSGMSAYLTGVTWGSITGTLSGQTDLSNALDNKVDNSVYQGDMLIIGGEIDGLISGLTTHTGDTSIHFTMAQVNQAISAATSGLTSSWNDLTDKPSWLSGTTLEEFQTGHTHSYDDLTDLPTIPTKTSELTNDSGFISGVTWGDITGTLSGQTDLQAALDAKLDNSVYQADMLIISDEIDTNASGITYISGVTDTKLAISDFTGYTGTTEITLTGITADISYISGITSGNAADIQWLSGYTSGMTTTLSGCTDVTITSPADYDILRYSGASWVNEATTDIFTNVDDGELLARNGTAITGVTQSKFALSGHTHSQYLTGITCSDVTGCTDGLYSPINHTHAYSAITDTPDLSVYQPISGMSIYLTGVTWNIITGNVSGNTNLQNALDAKLDNSVYQSDMLIIADEIDTNASGITYISGVTDTKLAISDFTGYTGTTLPATYAAKLLTINSLTGATYTTTDNDSNEMFEAASGCTGITLHSGATTGFQVTFVNLGGQTITFSAETGSTLRSKDSAVTLVDAYGAVSAYKNGTYWTLIGDLST